MLGETTGGTVNFRLPPPNRRRAATDIPDLAEMVKAGMMMAKLRLTDKLVTRRNFDDDH
jgi:hypothetical protein